jgi:hypothetical protein
MKRWAIHLYTAENTNCAPLPEAACCQELSLSGVIDYAWGSNDTYTIKDRVARGSPLLNRSI